MVRYKYRYLIFHVTWKDGKIDESIGEPALQGSFRDALQQLFGEYTLSRVAGSLRVIAYDPVGGICILRCSREDHAKLWCSITFVTMIASRIVSIRAVKVSGSLEAAKAAAREAGEITISGKQLGDAHSKLHAAFLAKVDAMD